MTLSYVQVLPTVTNLDLNLKEIASGLRANFKYQGVSDESGIKYDVYNYDAGAARDTFILKLHKKVEKSGMIANTIRLHTDIRETDSVTGLSVDMPVEIVFSWNFQPKDGYCPDTASLNVCAQVLASLVFRQLTGANGTPTTTLFDAFDRGGLKSIAW